MALDLPTPDMSTWNRIMSKIEGGFPLGEITILVAKTGSGKSRLTEYVAEQMKKEQTDGV